MLSASVHLLLFVMPKLSLNALRTCAFPLWNGETETIGQSTTPSQPLPDIEAPLPIRHKERYTSKQPT